MPYKLKITHKDKDDVFEDQFHTIEAAHTLRHNHHQLFSDPVATEEIYEVDDKGYRVVGSEVIFYAQYGKTAPTAPTPVADEPYTAERFIRECDAACALFIVTGKQVGRDIARSVVMALKAEIDEAIVMAGLQKQADALDLFAKDLESIMDEEAAKAGVEV
jgi:hypothetical protein